jgi:AcrR family transcriptional regulator
MERTAVELVLRDGLQGATVDAICEVAEVSTRTFFNYFDSKEDAILGLPHLEISEAAVLERATKNDGCEVVADVIGLIHQMTAPVLERGPLHKPRKILHRYPELAARQIGRLSRVNDDVLKAVHIFMRHDPRFTYLAGARSPLAELVLALCTSAVRTSAREWIAARSDASIDTVRTRAIALAREVIEKLL